jgi:hypothetical protein
MVQEQLDPNLKAVCEFVMDNSLKLTQTMTSYDSTVKRITEMESYDD